MAGRKKKTNTQEPITLEVGIEEQSPVVEGEIVEPVTAVEILPTKEVEPSSPAEVETLQEELEEARARADEYLGGWQRSMAEFANYKRRIDREQAQTYQLAVGNVLKRYLGILDDLERALKNRPQEGAGAAWSEGVELIYRKFLALLESEGVAPMEAEGQLFDPNFHEAIMSEDNDHYESGQIIEVLQQGYMLGDRVLRPAMVRVAR